MWSPVEEHDVKNDLGQLPLHLACIRCQDAQVRMLLERMSSELVAAQDYQGNTPLHLACMGSRPVGRVSVAIVRRLLERMEDSEIAALNESYETALDCALVSGSAEVALILMERMPVSSYTRKKFNKTTGYFAVQFGNKRVLDAMPLVALTHCTAEESSGLRLGLRGRTNADYVVPRLPDDFDASADILNGATLLHAACHASSDAVVKAVMGFLPEELWYAQSSTNGWSALHVACDAGNVDAIQALLDAADVGRLFVSATTGDTPLHKVSCARDAAVLLPTLSTAQIIARNGLGVNALHSALRRANRADSGSVAAVMLPYMPDAALVARDGFGMTALHYAVAGGHSEVVACLVDRLPVNEIAAVHNGRTVLHDAVDRTVTGAVALDEGKAIVQILLQALPPNARFKPNRQGRTPVDIAKGMPAVAHLFQPQAKSAAM